MMNLLYRSIVIVPHAECYEVPVLDRTFPHEFAARAAIDCALTAANDDESDIDEATTD